MLTRHIDSRGKVFRHLDRLVGWQRGEKPAPVTVEWDLSNRCTLGCQDCHFAHTHVKGPWASKARALPMAYDGTGDLADVDVVTRALGELAAAGVQGIVWSGGGEPTTHPSWTAIVERAAALGLQQGMYTLGGLLTPDSAAVLAAHAAFVVVSLDAADADNYGREKQVPPERFEAAVSGIRALVAARTPCAIGVSYLLHHANYWRAESMVEFSRSLGATYTTFRPAIRTSPDAPRICLDRREWITEALPVLEHLSFEPDVEVSPERFEAYRKWFDHGYRTCYGIRLNATITPDSRVWLCPQHRGVPGSCLGDLRRESFDAIWGRHAGAYAVGASCRVMCRLHELNQTLAAIEQPRLHEAFL